MAGPLNIEEFETLARERLEASVYGYFAGGSDDEITVRSNREAFQSLCLKYRVLVDVSQIDLSTRLAGISLSLPLLLAPTALQRMAHPEGEKATARAAAATGTLLTLSTVSSVALEEVAAAAPKAPLWFQLYHFNDRALTERLVRRAEQAGYGAIVLTVDAPMLGRRERDLRDGFTLPEGVRAVHFDFAPRSVRGVSPLAAYINQPSVDWKDLDWTRSLSGLPLFLKGIVRGDDARRAVESGVAGIWVSNHGGRQLDTAIPTARALPEVVEAVAGRVPVIVDGGIRRGTDIVKAIALGANAVAIGRPALWGLAARGEDGVREVIEMFRRELYLAMALAGCRSISEIDRSLVAS
ncbi:MAG: alpha-hydroxy acid oxidase [Thermoanaerobaculia bacterium]